MQKRARRVLVVGPGTRFLSGITYYTFSLCNALSERVTVSAILMRQLLPTALYPGRARVGASISRLELRPSIPHYDGVDWYWGRTIVRAARFLRVQRPDTIILQWWTGSVFHTYLVLVVLARLLGARIIIEFHEVLDTGEERIPVVRTYARLLGKTVVRQAHGFVIHSEYDRLALEQRYNLGGRPVALIPHGPYTQYRTTDTTRAERDAPASCCNLLFFGTIRPFKGLEDLVRAFDSIPLDEIEGYWLTVVGETWEGWTLPNELIARSRHRDHITFVNRYVRDEEAAVFFAGADAVVLPYHRSSASGPLQVTMSHGLPVVVTRVGGLSEAAGRYEGAIFVPPQDPRALRDALCQVASLKGRRFADPHSWERTVARYEELFDQLDRPGDRAGERGTRG
jgi:glycosyltransferase involved in cell wall biosynthesis